MGNDARLMYWLTIDMIGSTEKTTRYTTTELKQFNLALIDQIRPHLKELDLTKDFYKFTGDGWQFAVPSEKARNLCCLATIMAHKFQEEMASLLEDKAVEEIPPLRLAVCAGFDWKVQLPNDNIDWVGDGARNSARASERCYSNEIIIDENTRTIVSRDFDIGSFFNEPTRPKSKNEKEEPPLKHILQNLKSEAASDSSAPDFLVYTWDVLKGGVKPRTGEAVKYKSVKSNIDVHDKITKFDIIVDPQGEGISGGQLDFAFNPSVVQVEEVIPGDLLGANPNRVGPNIDQENGSVSLALARRGFTMLPTPAGTFVSLEVRLSEDASKGKYPFEVKNISMLNTSFKVIDPDKVKVSLITEAKR